MKIIKVRCFGAQFGAKKELNNSWQQSIEIA
jgi:hypothetical protein